MSGAIGPLLLRECNVKFAVRFDLEAIRLLHRWCHTISVVPIPRTRAPAWVCAACTASSKTSLPLSLSIAAALPASSAAGFHVHSVNVAHNGVATGLHSPGHPARVQTQPSGPPVLFELQTMLPRVQEPVAGAAAAGMRSERGDRYARSGSGRLRAPTSNRPSLTSIEYAGRAFDLKPQIGHNIGFQAPISTRSARALSRA